MQLAESLQDLAERYEKFARETFDFRQIHWKQGTIVVSGFSGPAQFSVSFAYESFSKMPAVSCTLCDKSPMCPHAIAAVVMMDETDIGFEIEYNDYEPLSFELKRKKQKKLPSAAAWKSQLSQLTQELKYFSPPSEGQQPRLPKGRELIYVIQDNQYSGTTSSFEIQLGTRPLMQMPTESAAIASRKNSGNGQSVFRRFSGGIEAWRASPDPLDREIAHHLSLVTRSFERFSSGGAQQFALSIDTGAELIARLARSGRLFFNTEYSIS